MRKIISLVLILCLSLVSTVVYGADTKKYQEILSTVKNRFSIDNSYDVFESTTTNRYNQNLYSFYWSTKENTKTLTVECDENGIVRNYSYYDTKNSDSFGIKKYTEAQYKEKAQSYIELVNPSLKDKLKVDDITNIDLYGDAVYATVSYVENGITVREFSGSIVIDANDMSLRRYYLNTYKNLTYPKDYIDLQTAKDAYKNLFGVDLIYEITYEEDKPTANAKFVLGSESNQYVNAVDGKMYTYEYQYGNVEYAGGASMENTKEDFSPAEIKEIENIQGLLSIENIESKLKSNSILNIPKDAKLQYSSLTKWRNNYNYQLRFAAGDCHYNITADAKTGKVSSVYNYGDFKKNVKKYTLENYAESLAGESYNEYKVVEKTEDTLLLQRYVNDVKVIGDVINVSSDKDTGYLLNYNISYTEVEFPSVENVISEEKALEIIFKNVDYSKIYLVEMNSNEIKDKAVMVYSFDNVGVEVDAFTGEFADVYETEKPIRYIDIEGHYAQNQIETLARYRIGFNEDRFYPDNEITQKNFISLLVKAFCNNYTIFDDYQKDFVVARNYNLITDAERNDEAPVTREEAAIFMARALNCEKYAQMENVWKLPFSDVNRNVGYVCIMYGLGIIKGDENGNFNPNSNISNADSAILIYNALISK